MTHKSCFGCLSGNQLKILAVISMTIDHIGAYLFPQFGILRAIGRLAFPIFAYMLAEGAKYTKSRARYLFTMTLSALLFQIAYFMAFGSLRQCIFVTFALSVILICALDKAKDGVLDSVIALAALLGVFFITNLLPKVLHDTDFRIDYGFIGVLLPVLIYLGANKTQKLFLLTMGLILLSASSSTVQWCSLAAVPFLTLYNGKRGRRGMKYFFYIYYPAHLAIIYLIRWFLR